MEASAEGLRALWISPAALGAAVIQAIVVAFSGSDTVDPALVVKVRQILRATPGLLGVGHVRLRWTGHQLRAECEVIVDRNATELHAVHGPEEYRGEGRRHARRPHSERGRGRAPGLRRC